MEEQNEEIPTLADFSQELKGESQLPAINSQGIDINDYVEEQQLEEGVPLKCAFCDWKTHNNAKDKKRGLRNHMKKCKHNPSKTDNKKEEKKIANILPPKVVEFADTVETIGQDEDAVRDKLIGDLDILKVKFANIPFTWSYNQNSSIAHLKRQKALFLRILNDEAGAEAVFNLLVLSSQGIEKIGNLSGAVDITGYSEDVKCNKDEIYPLLKNMVDTGVLDVGHLSPELRLGMIMTSLAINRMEANRLNRGSDFLGETPLEEQYDW